MKIRNEDDFKSLIHRIDNLSRDDHWAVHIRKIKKRKPRIRTRKLSVEDTFWMFTEKRDNGDCWLWKGPLRKNHDLFYGYFRKKTNGKLQQYSAKTLSLHINGRHMPPKPHIVSLCKNTLCVNPDHMKVYGRPED